MRAQPGPDIVAGLTVAVVALPLALAFGIASGLGAGAGLTSAIVAGFVAAMFGGSDLQVSGPTGAMTVVLVPIVAAHGPGGVLAVGMLAGAILLLLAWSGAARAMRFVPLPVVEGFTIGIAAVIALGQVPSALNVSADGDRPLALAADAVNAFIASPALIAPLIAVAVTAAILLAGGRWPRLPVALGAVAAAAVACRVFDLDIARIGELPSPLSLPSLPDVGLGDLGGLLPAALAVAALAALESLLSATVADAMTVGTRHDPDRELVGQGLANLVTPLVGGVPATAAIARTAVNVRAGGRSRLAAVTHSVALLVVALAASSLVAWIPLAALAGVLFATTARMVDLSSVRTMLRAAPADGAVLLITAAATLFLNLVTAVLIGLGVAVIIALRAYARIASVEERPLDTTDHAGEERTLLDRHVIAYRFDGPLFFAASHTALVDPTVRGDVRVVIFRLAHLMSLDTSGAALLADTITTLEGRDIVVLLSGLRPEHERLLEQLGVLDRLRHENHVFASTPDAIDHALSHLQRDGIPVAA
ncbi:MAG: SulP family inorganic anion transporter [Solirubrobacteraceae bacterium]|nr:SulP family inorganic anion transporter [Solirubrobacteraceae bacterium]